LSQISPAAVVSIADWAELPPSPDIFKVPKASELIVTEWPSKGPSAPPALSAWSNVKDNETFNPLSNSPLPAKVIWLPIVKLFPVLVSEEPVVFLTPMLAAPVAVSSPANADVVTSDAANAVKPIFFNLFIFFLCLFLLVVNN